MGFDTQKKGEGFGERGDRKHYVHFKEKNILGNHGISNTMLEWHLLQ